MRAALDATPLVGPVGGIRRYTAELASALVKAYPLDRYELVTDQHHDGVMSPSLTGVDRHWWLIGLPRYLRRHSVDVFHGTDFSVPYLPVCPSVMTVHDLSPWRFRDASPRVRRRTPWLLRMGLATMVITPTEAVRAEVIEHFRIPPEEVAAIHEAASDHFRPTHGAPPARPYFLCAGTMEARKNVDVVIAAWREVRKDHEVDLVLAGRARENFSPMPNHPGLSVLGETAEAELPRLYSHAVASLYLSSYEGFGLPVLEAMQCGAPVIASRDAAIREVAGDACILEHARDTKSVALAMRALLTNRDLREDLRQRGLRRAQCFSWHKAAEQTRAVYEKAIRRYHG